MKRILNSLPFLLNTSERHLAQAEQTFRKAFPAYSQTSALDQLRKKDFCRIDDQRHTYLDFTGAHLFGQSLVDQHRDFLSKTVLGNPHSINPTSSLAEKYVEEARDYVLDYFNAADDYVCIFTPNASCAIKIVAECYPFDNDSQLLLTFDNHNSVNGIREFARSKGAGFDYSPIRADDLRLDEPVLMDKLKGYQASNKLFAFPAQSNVSGVKHDLSFIRKAQSHGWDVLLDAAAFVPSDELDLQRHQPEFVSVSFYKIFGYPTGLGALLVKKSAYEKLLKPSFAGGTITIVSVQGDGHYLEKAAARFEDGTINYLEIPAIKTGLEYIQKIGIEQIKKRVHSLTGWLLNELQQLKHENGLPLIQIYGPKNMERRGGTLVMNFYDNHGKLYDFSYIEKRAYGEKISIRTGCFCNPGIDETNHRLLPEKLRDYFKKEGEKDYFDLINFMGQKRGAVRVSLGYVSNFKDVFRFVEFCKEMLNKEWNG